MALTGRSKLYFAFIAAALFAASLCFGANPPQYTVPWDRIPWDVKTAPERVVAIGDIHGDFDAMFAILRDRNLVDPHGKWIGGKTQVVFTGDLNDRGPDTRLVFDFIMNLEKEAQAAGGVVHTLIGNHELMMTLNQNDYLDPKEPEMFRTPGNATKSVRMLMRDVYGDGSPYAEWIAKRNTIVKIGDTVFVHAGLGDWIMGRDPGEINSTMRAWLKYVQKLAKRAPDAVAPPEESAWVTGQQGPVWNREMAYEKMTTENVDHILKSLDARRIVIGHTSEKLVSLNYDGKVINVDSGISRTMEGIPSAIEIQEGKVTIHSVERPERVTPLKLVAISEYKKGHTYDPNSIPSLLPNPKASDHYARLGINTAATREEIVEAFQRAEEILNRLTPEMTMNERLHRASDLFKIRQSYAILSDPNRRAKYDETLKTDPCLYKSFKGLLQGK